MISGVGAVDLCCVAKQTEEAYSRGSWRGLPIQECGEPLVLVPSDFTHPYYSVDMGLTDDRRVFLRKTVFQMFLTAHEIVKRTGLSLVIYDGWRSVELQENLFWYYLKLFTAPRFGLEDIFSRTKTSLEIKETFLKLPAEVREKAREANCTYVSWPSVDPSKPSPHITGGSIDVWLQNQTGADYLGVPFDWMEESAGAFYHLKKERSQFKDDYKVCRNREVLLTAMIEAGFSCLPSEIWHFNHGNQMDSLVTGQIARYSYVEP